MDTLASKSLIIFLTNGNETYVKIKNIEYNKYIKIQDDSEKKIVVGSDSDYTIFRIVPTYDYSEIKIFDCCSKNKVCVYNNLKLCCLLDDLSISSLNDTFCLAGDLKKLYLINNCVTTNNCMHMSENNDIHIDGKLNQSNACWIFELINNTQPQIEYRLDYMTEYNNMCNQSKKSIDSLMKNMLEQYTIMNVNTKQYLSAQLFGDLSKNKVMMSNEQVNVKISRYDDYRIFIYMTFNNENKYFYTLCEDDDLYIGAPKCDWALFYLIKLDNKYLIQCCHRESDKFGNYGRYLYVNDKGQIKSNGDNSFNSHWSIEKK